MPTRVIRDGFLDSETVKAAGEPAECLYHRLLLTVDDYGRFDGRPTLILNRCWPAGPPDGVDVDEVERRLDKLAELELILRYETSGKPFILVPRFRQRTRALKSRYPEPPPSTINRAALLETAPAREPKKANPEPSKPANDGQMTDRRPTNDGRPPDVCRLESETETETETLSKSITVTNRGGSTGLSPELSPNPPEEPESGAIARTAPNPRTAAQNPSLEARAHAFGMIRMPLETDAELSLRVQARANLG